MSVETKYSLFLQVNGASVETYTHDEVVQAMKNTEGDIVQLTVRHFRPASHFLNKSTHLSLSVCLGARCSSVVRAFAHGAMGRRINPSWGEPTELFLVPASAPRLV